MPMIRSFHIKRLLFKNGNIKTKILINIKCLVALMARQKIKIRIAKGIEKKVHDFPTLKKVVRDISAAYEKDGLKQVILMRKDLKLPAGKAAAQAAHASVEAVFKSDSAIVKKWRHNGAKKVVLRVDDVQEIYEYSQVAENEGLATAIITDAGRTVIAPGTVTCCAIGPAEEKIIDKITGNLKMY